jgi:hypothetical protein
LRNPSRQMIETMGFASLNPIRCPDFTMPSRLDIASRQGHDVPSSAGHCWASRWLRERSRSRPHGKAGPSCLSPDLLRWIALNSTSVSRCCAAAMP